MRTRFRLERRRFVQLGGIASLAALAGCAGNGGGDGGEGEADEETTEPDGEPTETDGGTTETDGEPTETDAGTTDGGEGDGEAGGQGLSGEEYPAVDEWLTESDVGAEAPNYDGTIVDQRDQETVTVDVGTGDAGTAFGPAAVAVSAGTTVTWEWTGEGGAHNVVAAPDHQIGESDYEFSSGDPVDSADETYEQTLDESGIALYHCEPHLPVGMKGAVVVE